MYFFKKGSYKCNEAESRAPSLVMTSKTAGEKKSQTVSVLSCMKKHTMKCSCNKYQHPCLGFFQ